MSRLKLLKERLEKEYSFPKVGVEYFLKGLLEMKLIHRVKLLREMMMLDIANAIAYLVILGKNVSSSKTKLKR